MKELATITAWATLFIAGLLIGMAISTPGKSESHAILNAHGNYEAVNAEYLIYSPRYEFMSTEEYEALAVVSTLYEHIAIDLNR